MTAVAVGALYLLSFYGVGRVLARILRVEADGFARASSLGLAGWILIGGGLNAVHLASAPVVMLAVAASLLAATPIVLRELRARTPPALAQALLVWSPVLLMAASIAVLAIPTVGLSPTDDLQNYALLPLRMLDRGTLAASGLDSLGVDALGAQSFLQSFVLTVLPLGYVTAFDNVACLVLAGVLLDRIGEEAGCHPVLRWLSLAALVVVNMQQINLSAVYSGAAATAGLLLATRTLLADLDKPVGAARVGVVVVLGLHLAALCALKMPHALFALVYAMGLGTLLLSRGARPARVRVLLWLAGSAALALVPWLLVAAQTHADAIAELLSRSSVAEMGSSSGIADLLRNRASFWGNRTGDYWALLLLGAGGLVVAVVASRPRRGGPTQSISRPGCHQAPPALALVAAATVVALMSSLVDAEHGVRYAAPTLGMSALSAVAVASAALAPPSAPTGIRSRAGMLAGTGCLTAVFALFASSFAASAADIARKGHLYGYPLTRADAETLRAATSPEARRFMRWLQAKTDAGATIFAPTGLSFHLDFARNSVISLHGTNLAAPWSPLRGVTRVDELRAVLAGHGVRYLLVQRTGVGIQPLAELGAQRQRAGSMTMRRIAAGQLTVRALLTQLAARGTVLYRGPIFTLVEL